MPLDPLDYLHVAARAANAFRRRYPFLDADDVQAQARLILVQVAPRYDPVRCPDPVRFLAYTLQRRLIDWFRQHAPCRRTSYRKLAPRHLRPAPLPFVKDGMVDVGRDKARKTPACVLFPIAKLPQRR